MSGVVAEHDPAARLRAAAEPAAVAALAACSALALLFRDPHRAGSWGWCPLHRFTGLACPLCGGLRAVYDLERGALGAAVHSNVLVVVLLPVAALALARAVILGWRTGRSPQVPPRTGAVLAVVLVAFGILRNLPGVRLGP